MGSTQLDLMGRDGAGGGGSTDLCGQGEGIGLGTKGKNDQITLNQIPKQLKKFKT